MFDFLKKHTAVGIDISDYSIEVLQLGRDGEVAAYARVVLDEGIVRDGRVLDKEKLHLKLQEALNVTRPKSIFPHRRKLSFIVSVPESQTFIHIFQVPKNLSGHRMEAAVYGQVLKSVPLDHKKVFWDYYILGYDDAGFQHVLYAGALQSVINDYREVFGRLKTGLVIFDAEVASMGRALIPRREDGAVYDSVAILDIGARSTTLGIFSGSGILGMSASVPFGGDVMTRAIADRLGMSLRDAEAMKREFGFDFKNSEHKAFSVMQETAKEAMKEISYAIAHFEQKYGTHIDAVILTGGTALLPHIEEYFSVGLEKPVIFGNPMQYIGRGSSFDGSVSPVFFSNAAGLALRGAGDASAGLNLLRHQGEIAMPTSETEILQTISSMKHPSAGFEKLTRTRAQKLFRFFAAVFACVALGALALVIYVHLYQPSVALPPAPQRTQTESEALGILEKELLVEEATVSIEETATLSVEIYGEEGAEPEKIVPMAVIQNTTTGWLNVRKGPGTGYAIVDRVTPGDRYEIVEEEKEWYKIRLDDETEGWVSGAYVVAQ